MQKCVVIGSGIAGLASSIRLAAKGYQVDVYEANAQVGGKIRQQFACGYRFDMGPSIITLPELVDELFELHDKNPRDYFDYTILENPFKYFYEDGTVINAYADSDKFAQEISAKTTDSGNSFKKYLKNIARKYNITKPVFIESSIHRFSDLLHHSVLLGLLRFTRIEAFKSMNKSNQQHFKDSKLVTLFNNYATYVGSNPFVAPATLNVIQHLELSLGMYMPDKGVYSMITALYKLASEVGVNFYFNTKVDQIITERKKAIGIKIANKDLYYDVIVSNMDVHLTYRQLLPDVSPPSHVIKQQRSNSVIAFYWGVNRTFENLGVHNMLFTEDQKEEFRTIYEEKNISSDTSLYIYISSKHVPEDAPKGKENWFILISAPYNEGQDWDQIVAQTRKNAFEKINRMLKVTIEDHIEYEDHIDPKSIETDLLSSLGSVYGNSSNNRFAAFFRHANFSKEFKNLFFSGGSVHPGAGIPLCLNSAKIMCQMIAKPSAN